MGKSVLYVGLDVHKMSMDVAIAEAGPGAEVRGKSKQTIVTAIARELAAFLWAISQAVVPVTA